MFNSIDYGSENNVVMQRLVEKLQLTATFHLDQAWIKFSTWQCVKEVLCDIAPMDSCDKGLIPTKDDGPWHMLRRKGVP